uniref:DUF3325 domain-containing protein n=1 Tax=uncultured Caulobacter sp. TaxID=158749 RepID=UPI0025F155D5|nr:DUF3325 domain-containing protein [uncultured Caulobacter sp.]
MTLLALLLSLAGFTALALAMDRHHHTATGARPAKRRKRLLQLAGILALTLAFVVAIAAWGWAYGPIYWLGLLTAGAAPALLALTYAPPRRKP